jgi:hypothetical protein
MAPGSGQCALVMGHYHSYGVLDARNSLEFLTGLPAWQI